MGGNRKQAETAAGTFDAQQAVERLESEMAEIRGELALLQQSANGIEDIKNTMVTVSTLDNMMQKYLCGASSSTAAAIREPQGH